MKPLLYVFSCEHAGNSVPPTFAPLFRHYRRLLRTHRGYDIGILPVARRVAVALHGKLITHHVTRLLVDVNRSVGNSSVFSEVTASLPKVTRSEILTTHYLPHRELVTRSVRSALAHRRKVVHVGFHSFTPELNGVTRQAEIGILYDPRRSNEVSFSRRFREELAKTCPQWRIRMNYPYRGIADGLVTALRAQVGTARYAGIELEVNQLLLNTHNSRRKVARCIALALAAVRG